jgi:hypothetical protein
MVEVRPDEVSAILRQQKYNRVNWLSLITRCRVSY